MNESREKPPSSHGSSPDSEKSDARKKKPISPEKELPPGLETLTSQSRVIVKFKDNSLVPKLDFPASDLFAQVSADAAKLAVNIVLKPHFKASALDRVRQRFQRITDKDPTGEWPRLEAYREADVRDEKQGHWLARELRTLDNVETAYLHPGPVVPPMVYSDDDPLAAYQKYLDPAPWGIDARYAWTVKGGDGKNQRLADIEWGWNLEHEDLVGHDFTNIATGFYKYLAHGTKVLGVIAARDNKTHCVGITPKLKSVVTIGQWRSKELEVTDEAILDAILEMDMGDVLLLEAQTEMYGYSNIPLEAEPAVFDMVWVATYFGIVVVAAAGNGGVDLDQVEDDYNAKIFDRNVRDSGAIIVGSAWPYSNPQWKPAGSCHGSCVDCFAWGEGVVTLSSDYWGDSVDEWSENFTATSAATAIVAGAALAVQGVVEESHKSRLSPLGMRWYLSNPEYNTPSADYVNDHIGVMPDLHWIIKDLAPD